VFRNFIHTLETPNNTSTTASNIYGIRQVPSGVATIANNIVVLQGAQTALLHGLYDNGTGGTTNFYHNTVYVGGTAAAGSAASYALWSNASTAAQDYRNNILVNQRTGGSGLHYGIRLQSNATLTIDQNTYWVSGSGVLGRMNTTDYNTLSTFQAATVQDLMSDDADPLLANGVTVGGAIYDVHTGKLIPQEI
jgi:hypothetical protein